MNANIILAVVFLLTIITPQVSSSNVNIHGALRVKTPLYTETQLAFLIRVARVWAFVGDVPGSPIRLGYEDAGKKMVLTNGTNTLTYTNLWADVPPKVTCPTTLAQIGEAGKKIDRDLATSLVALRAVVNNQVLRAFYKCHFDFATEYHYTATGQGAMMWAYADMVNKFPKVKAKMDKFDSQLARQIKATFRPS